MTYPNGITLDADFTGGVIPAGWTFNRTSSATDSFYTDASGSSYNSFANDVPRFRAGVGWIFEAQARTNYLLNSTAPATQTTPSLGVANHVLWVIGTGSAAVTAGTGVATGLGTATQGNPLYFAVTTVGTFTVTVTGSLNRFQLERGASPTSFIVTAGAIATRAAETCFQNIGAWFNAAAGTLALQFSAPVLNTNTNATGLLSLDDTTINNRISLQQNGFLQSIVTTGGVQQINVNAVSIVANTMYREAVRYSSTDMRFAGAGVFTTAQIGKTIPTVTRLAFVPGATASLGCTYFVQRAQYWPFALSDADMQSATLLPPQAQLIATGTGYGAGISTPTIESVIQIVSRGGGARGDGRVKSSIIIPPPVYDLSLGVYDLALNRLDHDMVFTNTPVTDYSIWPINGADKVAQEIKMNLLTFFGEWFLDVTFGVPYLEEILVKNPRMSTVESILRSHILDVPHVLVIDWLTLAWDRQNRQLNVEFQAETDYGPIQESYKLEVPRV